MQFHDPNAESVQVVDQHVGGLLELKLELVTESTKPSPRGHVYLWLKRTARRASCSACGTTSVLVNID